MPLFEKLYYWHDLVHGRKHICHLSSIFPAERKCTGLLVCLNCEEHVWQLQQQRVMAARKIQQRLLFGCQTSHQGAEMRE
jgi:hypothetical protein